MQINEFFLQFVWRNLFFRSPDLFSFQGHRISIINPGEINDNAGPDFLNAHIVINDVDFLGNIEVHVKSSDWDLHKHSKNKLYDNTVLHVVWIADKKICCKDGSEMPILVIKDYVDEEILCYLNLIIEKSYDVFCQNFFTLDIVFKKLIHNRILIKKEQVNKLFKKNRNDFLSTVFQFLMYNFGFKVNNLSMLSLAESIPFSIVQKICHDHDLLFSLFCGQADLFDRTTIDNVDKYKEIYAFLKNKYALQRPRINWRFARTRPGNSPIKRITQLVNLFCNNDFLYDWVMNNNVDAFRQRLLSVQPALSKESVDNLVINVFLPLTAFYNKIHRRSFVEIFVNNLILIPPENNKVVRKFFSIHPRNAFETQALIELFNNYCSKSRCLRCPVRFSKK